MRTKLTDAVCSQRPPKSGRIEIWDTVLPGLCIRIYPSGARTFSLMPRERSATGRRGRQRRVSMWPRYPLLTLAEARKQARALMMEWAAGADLPAPRAASPTVAEVVELWLAIDQAQNRSHARIAAEARKVLAPWWDAPIGGIGRKHIQAIVDNARNAQGVVTALRRYALLRRLFKWALLRQYIEVNPATGIDVPRPNPPRQRTLTDDELRAVWLAAGELRWPYCPIVRLLILTGARRGEVRGLTWSELNLERAEWILPRERAKNGVEHLVPLSPQALAILEAIPRVDNPADLVFPAPWRGRVINEGSFWRIKLRLDAASGVEDWVIHDLRRSVATGLQRMGVKKEVTEAVLNHVSGSRAGIVGVYQTYTYADEKRAALDAWGRHVDHILTGEPAKVVNLPKRGA